MNLFKTKIPEDKLHESFKQIRTDPVYAPVRKIIQSWGVGLLDRQGEQKKFINEFQTTFNSSMWELYLNKMFIELGFSVDYSKNSPDFYVTNKNGYQFNVEAVISDISKASAQKIVVNDFKDHSTIKLVGKLKDKRDIFLGKKGKKCPYSSLDHVKGKPFIIAIAPFDSDLSLTQNNTIINRVLLGVEPPDETGTQQLIESITKPSGASVDLGLFTNDSYKEVSAVIFSTTGTFGKAVVESGINRIVRTTRYRQVSKGKLGTEVLQLGPLNYLRTTRYDFDFGVFGADVHVCGSDDHNETHLDGLQIYYNPYAEIPLNRGVFSRKEIAHNFFDLKENTPVQEHPDRALVSRQLYDVDHDIFMWLLKSHIFYS